MPDATHIEDFLIPGTDHDVAEQYRNLPVRAHDMAFSLVEDEVVIVDTETTGFDPTRESLIEIAAVTMRGNDILDSFHAFANPGRPLPAEIVELTGITDADLANAPDPSLAVEQFAAFAGQRDLVAHNASFDRSFVMCQAVPGALRGSWLDTLALSHIVLPRFKSHTLKDLSRAFGLHQPEHRAADDVEALASLWRILLAGLQELPVGLAGALAVLSPETDWPLRPLLATAAAAQPDADFSLRRERRERTGATSTTSKFDADEVPLSFPEDAELEHAFTPQGTAGAMYAGYEQRSEQVQMAHACVDAFRTRGFAAIEAGTGVGKSMAYLLPAARIAQDNAITIGVATKTNALMDQLVYHELPRLSKAMGGLRCVALKGYEHYPCLRKIEHWLRDGEELECSFIEALGMLCSYAAQTTWGDLDALNLHWTDALRKPIEANPFDCLKSRCPFYPRSCFLHGARKSADGADIVVTNHALLFRDIQMDNGILPPIRHWIVDEAHAVEHEARKQLSCTIAARELGYLLSHLTAHAGTIASIRRKAARQEGADLLYALSADVDNRVGQVQAIATSFFSFVKDLADDENAGSNSYERVTLWVGPELRASGAWARLEAPGRSLASKLDALVKRLRDLVSTLEQFEGAFAGEQGDLANATSSLGLMSTALSLVLEGTDTSYVYSAEINRNPDKVAEQLCAEKLDIGAELVESFYPSMQSVVFTSATLATGSAKAPFAHFLHVSGLDRLDPARVKTYQLNSSYDFDRNMTIYLPTGIPDPNGRGYRDSLAKLLFDVHEAMGGSVLTLFTNRREMEALYRLLKEPLLEQGIELTAQLRGISAKNLRERFLENETLSLFALRSFWEGFDAPGDTLRCVIIPKLPFGRPNDPITCERRAREQGASWRRYSLPEAVMDLKQAAGRLIRNSTDSGYLVLADARLQTKGYGKTFLRAMPTNDIRCLPLADIIREMREEGE